MIFIFFGPIITAASLMMQAEGVPPDADEISSPEIVVTGRRGEEDIEPDAVPLLESHCFDPMRRSGHPVSPDLESRWFPLEPDNRQQFSIVDSKLPAYGLTDNTRGHELWLKIEEVKRSDGLSEDRCTLLVIGGTDHDRFVKGMSELFHGAPTRRHVGHEHGVPAVPGWQQWLWTAMPQRGSEDWRSISRGRGAEGQSWVVVLDTHSFYRDNDYVYGDLKIRTATPLISMLTIGFVRRRD
ncbi:MAG: hypothetical protein K5821_15360 [Nitrobacter sp.]|uniref:hypothetical protein n=1 Tax=Nitrobacter sp. TaxID=29420 RepID=UPI00261BAB3C|nr:hypothetical protein [Nitrobacter sp.]MCV0387762.1 hypothetical protein [Nitrobacter sp.]